MCSRPARCSVELINYDDEDCLLAQSLKDLPHLMRAERLFTTYEIAYGVDDLLYFGRESNSSTTFDDLEVIERLAPYSGVVVPIVTVDSGGYDRLPSGLKILA